jgi:ABC-type glycerol-3-phosphate transport system substrate-binding protein
MSKVVLAVCAVLLLLAEAHAQSDWKKEWEKTIEAAKKEGQVNVYIGGWEAVLESGAFQKAYPEIKVTWVGGRAGEIAKRILAERRAGKFLADVARRYRLELPGTALGQELRSDQTRAVAAGGDG